ncbi:cytochrome c1 [Pacificimonas sp. ICDLI1SI03]|jgi:ubiquinol-cytochrome c reductase cytochrome c1 subunit|tara:strand:+ start:45312 stop:46160 length:849 start_codon:yes stop_codon:yes gene_type:complete
MFRFISYAIGLVFIFVLALAAVTGLIDSAGAETSEADLVREEFHASNKDVHWSWEGPMGLGVFGGFDDRQLQRGFQVYKEVCSSCHSLKRVAFRSLQDIGFNEAEVKQIAADWINEVPDINPDTGETTTRKATPADTIPLVYPNEIAARAANNNALPPDMSLLTKARPHGSDYLYSLITGYEPVPANFPEDQVSEGLHYNPHFHSLWIAMPPQLSDGLITYADGTPATVDQMGQDVTAFLTWAAEPKMEARKAAGIGTIVFLIIFTAFAYVAYRRVWADVKH